MNTHFSIRLMALILGSVVLLGGCTTTQSTPEPSTPIESRGVPAFMDGLVTENIASIVVSTWLTQYGSIKLTHQDQIDKVANFLTTLEIGDEVFGVYEKLAKDKWHNIFIEFLDGRTLSLVFTRASFRVLIVDHESIYRVTGHEFNEYAILIGWIVVDTYRAEYPGDIIEGSVSSVTSDNYGSIIACSVKTKDGNSITVTMDAEYYRYSFYDLGHWILEPGYQVVIGIDKNSDLDTIFITQGFE